MMMRLRILAILTVVSALGASVRADTPAANLRSWYDKPAKDWMTEALPIGNGRLGAMIFGGIEREHIQFNEDSLWVGNEHDTGAYQAFGDVYIDLGRGGMPALTTAECASGQPSPDGQTVEKSIDGSVDTKWCMEHQNKPVVWVGHYLNPVAISRTRSPRRRICRIVIRRSGSWKDQSMARPGSCWIRTATSRPIRSGTNARFTPLIMTRSFCTIGSRSPTFARSRIFNWPKSNWGVKGMSDSGQRRL